MTDAQKLINIENRIARAVASVHGYITKSEIDERDRLQKIVGREFDAVNNKWVN
jgi:hypothetical protein|tara:strand:+ start:1813 stop:1974 length:162 start_codon:yes stop_codon:yes gene_type:complete